MGWLWVALILLVFVGALVVVFRAGYQIGHTDGWYDHWARTKPLEAGEVDILALARQYREDQEGRRVKRRKA